MCYCIFHKPLSNHISARNLMYQTKIQFTSQLYIWIQATQLTYLLPQFIQTHIYIVICQIKQIIQNHIGDCNTVFHIWMPIALFMIPPLAFPILSQKYIPFPSQISSFEFPLRINTFSLSTNSLHFSSSSLWYIIILDSTRQPLFFLAVTVCHTNIIYQRL